MEDYVFRLKVDIAFDTKLCLALKRNSPERSKELLLVLKRVKACKAALKEMETEFPDAADDDWACGWAIGVGCNGGLPLGQGQDVQAERAPGRQGREL